MKIHSWKLGDTWEYLKDHLKVCRSDSDAPLKKGTNRTNGTFLSHIQWGGVVRHALVTLDTQKSETIFSKNVLSFKVNHPKCVLTRLWHSSEHPRQLYLWLWYDLDIISQFLKKMVSFWSRTGPPPPLGRGDGHRDRLTVTNLRHSFFEPSIRKNTLRDLLKCVQNTTSPHSVLQILNHISSLRKLENMFWG